MSLRCSLAREIRSFWYQAVFWHCSVSRKWLMWACWLPYSQTTVTLKCLVYHSGRSKSPGGSAIREHVHPHSPTSTTIRKMIFIHPSIDDSSIVLRLRVCLIAWICRATELDLRGYWRKRSRYYFYKKNKPAKIARLTFQGFYIYLQSVLFLCWCFLTVITYMLSFGNANVGDLYVNRRVSGGKRYFIRKSEALGKTGYYM